MSMTVDSALICIYISIFLRRFGCLSVRPYFDVGQAFISDNASDGAVVEVS